VTGILKQSEKGAVDLLSSVRSSCVIFSIKHCTTAFEAL